MDFKTDLCKKILRSQRVNRNVIYKLKKSNKNFKTLLYKFLLYFVRLFISNYSHTLCSLYRYMNRCIDYSVFITLGILGES
jgi:hypothetical protein